MRAHMCHQLGQSRRVFPLVEEDTRVLRLAEWEITLAHHRRGQGLRLERRSDEPEMGVERPGLVCGYVVSARTF